MNRWSYDFEFLEDGRTIDPISVGFVSFDGSITYYAGCAESDLNRAALDPWMRDNVLKKLPPRRADSKFWRPRSVIAQDILGVLGIVRGEARLGVPELWADHASYDHVALCQLYGRMIDLPSGMPYYSMDLQQLLVSMGRRRSELPRQDPDLEHHALEDALHLRRCHRWALGLEE